MGLWPGAFVDAKVEHQFGEFVNPGMPRLYHLLRDPKEQYDLIHYGGVDGFWVMPAIMERVAAHQKTLMKEPPIKLGTPDPYVPVGKK